LSLPPSGTGGAKSLSPASSTPYAEGRDAAKERGLSDQAGAVISKDSQKVDVSSKICCLWHIPESIQGASALSCFLSGPSQEWPTLPLSTQCPHGGLSLSPVGPAPYLGSFPPSQGECQLGAPLPRSVKEGTGVHAVPRVDAAEHCQAVEPRPVSGMSSIRGHREGRSAMGYHPDLESPCEALPHRIPLPQLLRLQTRSLIPAQLQHSLQLYRLSTGTNPRQYFYLFDSK